MDLLSCQRRPYQRRLVTPIYALEGRTVTTRDTVLYPEGGGQPSDFGRIGGIAVEGLRRQADGSVAHTLAAEHPAGWAAGTEVEIELDWTRRFDHMQQHTAQHLLTAVAQQLFGWATTSFHLGAARCDIELDADELGAARLAQLEERVNELIRAGRPVSQEVHRDLPAGDVRSRGLPADWTGPVRLIEIAGLDRNTCGGTHVADLRELQAIKLSSWERRRGGTRLYWWAGGRVLAQLARFEERERALVAQARVPADELLPSWLRLEERAKAARREARELAGRLLELEARALLAQPGAWRAHHRPEAELKELQQIARTVCAARPEALLLLTGGEEAGVFLLAGPEETVATLGPQVAATLGGRGGGRKGRYQGRASQLSAREEAVRVLQMHLGG